MNLQWFHVSFDVRTKRRAGSDFETPQRRLLKRFVRLYFIWMPHFCTSSVVLIITSEHAILILDCLKRDETEEIEHKYKCTTFIVKETKCLDLYGRLSTQRY